MNSVERVMIEARRNLAKNMIKDGKNEDEIYSSVVAIKYEPYITEIKNAEHAIENYARYYHARKEECPDSFKFLMLINGWCNPFVALNELLKVIDKNEMLLKRKQKETGVKCGYKSRYREMMSLVQKWESIR